MSEMNDIPAKEAISKDCLDTAKLLDELAAEARKGNICAVGVAAVKGPGQVAPTFTTNFLMEQYIGADLLKANLLAMMTGQHPIQQAQKARQPQIIRPAPGMQVK
jgi:hypothetical protein